MNILTLGIKVGIVATIMSNLALATPDVVKQCEI